MNLKDYISKNWNFKKDIEYNVFNFNENKKTQERKNLLKLLGLSSIIILLGFILPHNPMLMFLVMGVTFTYGSQYIYQAAEVFSGEMGIAKIDSTHIVIVWASTTGNGGAKAVIGTIANGNEITYGTAVQYIATNPRGVSVDVIDSTHFIVTGNFHYDGVSKEGSTRVGTISGGTTISFGTKVQFSSGVNGQYYKVKMLNSTDFVITWSEDNTTLKAIIGQLDGSYVATFGTAVTISSGGSSFSPASVEVLDSTHFAVVYRDLGNSNKGTAIIGVVSGTTITFGSEYVFANYDIEDEPFLGKIDSTHFVIMWNSNVNTRGYCIFATVASGNQISYGSEYVIGGATDYARNGAIAVADSTHFVVAYDDAVYDKGRAVMATLAGSVITYSAYDEFETGSAHTNRACLLDSTHYVGIFNDVNNTSQGTSIIGAFALPVAYTLAMGQGSYTLSGQALTFDFHEKDITMAMDQGSYALTGQDLLYNRGLNAMLDYGSYTLSGQAVTLDYHDKDIVMTMEYGSYAYSGQTITLTFHEKYTEEPLQTNSFSKTALSTNSYSKEPLAQT